MLQIHYHDKHGRHWISKNYVELKAFAKYFGFTDYNISNLYGEFHTLTLYS